MEEDAAHAISRISMTIFSLSLCSSYFTLSTKQGTQRQKAFNKKKVILAANERGKENTVNPIWTMSTAFFMFYTLCSCTRLISHTNFTISCLGHPASFFANHLWSPFIVLLFCSCTACKAWNILICCLLSWSEAECWREAGSCNQDNQSFIHNPHPT